MRIDDVTPVTAQKQEFVLHKRSSWVCAVRAFL